MAVSLTEGPFSGLHQHFRRDPDRLRRFLWCTKGGEACPDAESCSSRGACPPRRPCSCRNVHRLAKMAPRSRFGAFVYTVAPLRTDMGRRSVHRSAKMGSRRRFGAFVYTVATRESREPRRVARVPQPPWRAGGAPRWPPLAWSKRQALRERRRHQVGVFAEAATHTNPRGAI